MGKTWPTGTIWKEKCVLIICFSKRNVLLDFRILKVNILSQEIKIYLKNSKFAYYDQIQMYMYIFDNL